MSPEWLTAPVKISGQPVANLVASTSGTDSDWVVKVIDVGPDDLAMSEREAAQLLRATGVELQPGDVDSLVSRTEGWPAGP